MGPANLGKGRDGQESTNRLTARDALTWNAQKPLQAPCVWLALASESGAARGTRPRRESQVGAAHAPAQDSDLTKRGLRSPSPARDCGYDLPMLVRTRAQSLDSKATIVTSIVATP